MAVEKEVLYFEGKYNPDRRFVINNWTEEDILSYWDGKPISIKAGEMYECGHAIARKLTKEIVDREMFKKAEEAYRSAGDNKAIAEKLRERAEMATLSQELRKPLEDKTISEIRANEESPIIAKMREEIRKEEQAKLVKSPEGSLSNDVAATKGESTTKGTYKGKKKGEFEE